MELRKLISMQEQETGSTVLGEVVAEAFIAGPIPRVFSKKTKSDLSQTNLHSLHLHNMPHQVSFGNRPRHTRNVQLPCLV